MIFSKWLILPVFVFLILILLWALGRKSVVSEIMIPASSSEVWSVIMDTGSYSQWNTVMTVLDGELEVGAKVKYRFHQDSENSYEITSTVKQVLENELLNQGGGTTGILTFDHKYVLEPVVGGTKVTIHELYRGIAVPFWNPKPVELAYDRLSQKLKARVIEVYQ